MDNEIIEGFTKEIAGGRIRIVAHDKCSKMLPTWKGRLPKIGTVVTCECGQKVKITDNVSFWDSM